MATECTILTRNGGLETKALSPIKAIRQKCLECSNWSVTGIQMCPVKACALYEFRFGKDPGRKKRVLSDEQRKIVVERFRKARENAAEQISAL